MSASFQRSFDDVEDASQTNGGASSTVVLDTERAAVARIRFKAFVWLTIFLVALIAAVVAGTDRSGGPAVSEQVTGTVARVDTAKNSVMVEVNGVEYPFRHRTHSQYAYHVGDRLQIYVFNGEVYESLKGVSNLTMLSRAYPWLACAALALACVALTYTLGWRRAASVIRDADTGDPIAIAYLKRGPQLGTVEWWWATPPVRPSSERRKVVVLGVMLLCAAVAFIAMLVVMWLLGGLGSASGLLVAFAFSALPFAVLAIWCFVFAVHPSEGKIRALRWMGWALLGSGLLGLLMIGWLSHDSYLYAGGTIAMVYGASQTFVRALRSLGTIALPGPVTMPRYRERIEQDIARRARAESQVASEGWGLDMVRAKRERSVFVRYTLISIGFIAIIVVAAWLKTVM
ncbi:hypothetical protein [Bifidobacterium felsineum]|uniref:Uncharacterized protein n=1 Tax=Bifidobacterium felsineum TaxID=2045440 RepID=A0A2M9HMD2_9BIFI|nr:hypothetical protein [Bifidobacterium felsineum]MBT1163277.1 hypothetical protein [Bifidobacterium felsineum]PJM77967.1 hypothetical protein CSQ86_02690 [Bifidobacterium felsineum]